jgi:hypothetical protein
MAVATKTRLKAVTPKASEPTRPKILIFGKPNVGKSWTALDFPASYYIDTEGGAKEERYIAKLEASGGVYFGPEHGATSFDEVMSQIKALATEDHPYRTVVIDSVSKLFALEVAREAERLSDANKKNEFAADRKPAVAYMRQLVAWLMRLDMNAILIAHARGEWVREKGERVEIGDTFDCWDKLEYELDLCLHIIEQGPSRLARVRKTRLGAFQKGFTFPWSYNDFADIYGRAIIEGETKKLALATSEQLEEIKRLLDIVKLEDGRVEKWLNAANVSSWDDMDEDKIEKCISFLKEKLAPKDT